MSGDNKLPGGSENLMGVSEKKVVLNMIRVFKQTGNDDGLRNFLHTKMSLDVQETEIVMAEINNWQEVIFGLLE